ncbi:MAG: delta-class carbonic anhydrase [Colwellia sp.]
MKINIIALTMTTALITTSVYAKDHHPQVANNVIEKQRTMLENNTVNKGYGPQSPRDLSVKQGSNTRIFGLAPASTEMNLCNIHLHKNAEHKGGEFTQYAGNGDGTGYQTGFVYAGQLSQAETKKITQKICPNPHGGLSPGDTIEVHYVYSTAQAQPGKSLAACLAESTINPQLRVETQVVVVVNDKSALDFGKLTKHGIKNDKHQAFNIPSDTGSAIQYTGSTTGPSYNEKGSPFQVTWSVRPNIAKVDITTVGEWCKGNAFKEDHAHGVRNLVVNPKLLSEIK